MTPFALHLSGIRKRFGRVVALDGAELQVRRGTVHALLGENGAGKTTLMRIAFGLTTPDEGTIRIDGATMRFTSPADAMAAGVGMVQQHFALVPAMSARENIALGATSGRRMRDDTLRLAAQMGVRLDREVPVAELSVSDQQRIELLRVLTRGARVLILDEPTAALAPAEVDELLQWVRAFRERGGSVVLITHKLREALNIADAITVLRRGVVTWDGAREEASIDGLVTAMLGRAHALPVDSVRTTPAHGGTAMAAPRVAVAIAKGLVLRDSRGVVRVREASLQVGQGEILGVAGVEGSGSRELLYAVAGRLRPESGELLLPDEIGFIPEDRQRDALLLDESVSDNVALRGAAARRGWFHRSTAEAMAERLLSRSGIRAADVRAPVSTLSGGNQQRLVLARELDGTPPLLVAANPARGLDLAGAATIQQRIREAAQAGTGVVYHTPDLDELIETSDRVVVVFEGRVREVDVDRDAVGRAMLGAS